MASQKLHEEKAQIFKTALKDLPHGHTEWEIIIQFYIVLHGIRAFMAAKGDFSGYNDEPDYSMFNSYLGSKRYNMATVGNKFNELIDLSQDARYKCMSAQEYRTRGIKAQNLYDEICRELRKQGIAI